MKYLSIILLTLTSLQIFSCTKEEKTVLLAPVQLTCEYVQDPAVVDVEQPRLAWINTSQGVRGQRQTSYHIRVASTIEKLETPDLWDSKKVISSQSNRVEYAGKALQSRQDCWWQVRVWDKDDQVSEWSEPARWAMGLLKAEDWHATWVGAPWQGEDPLPDLSNPNAPLEKLPPPAPLLRKKISVSKEVLRAKAFITGLGYFEFYVNGQKISDDVLVPNQTNYGKRDYLMERYIPVPDDFREYKVMYLSYDITDRITFGENTLGAILGNGFYNASKYWTGSYGSPRFLGQIHITYTDGTEDIIVSDESWKASRSPILMDMVYYGEKYDARLEQPGWSISGFDDSGWENVIKREAPFGKLVAHTPHPDKVMERLEPISIEKLEDGKYKVDFGVEISGWVRLNEVSGPEGQQVDIKFLSNQYSGDNTYIFKGGEPETYAPRFNWFVFSAVEISNWPGELKKEHLTAEAVNTWVEESATFETSNQLFNDINRIWKRSQLDNMHGGLASDCPHRERSGYTGDGQVACVTVMHNFDARSFYDKWIQDIRGAQIVETGYVPNGAPWQPGCGGGVPWGAAMNIMPWEFYLHYGSLDMLEDNYEAMKEYIRYMKTWVDDDGIMYSQRTGKDGEVLKWFNLGDWSCLKDAFPPDDMVHTFYLWRCSELTGRTAKVLGHEEEAGEYFELAEETRNAFQKRFYNEENGTYGRNGGNIFALKMGVPKDQYQKVIESLRSDIKSNDGHLDTGIFGTQFFFEVLSENGLHEMAYEAMNKRTQPSYGYWLEEGATTTREDWDNSGSHNHPMFGGGIVWFYRKLAGMNTDPERPGYKHIIFKPMPVDDIQYARYSNNTVNGEAGIHWKKENGKFIMNVKVPVGSVATVYIPATEESNVMEGNMKASEAKYVAWYRMEDGYAVYSVGSGEYSFSAPIN